MLAAVVLTASVTAGVASAAERPRLAGEWTLTERSRQASENTLPAPGETRTWRFRYLSGARVLLSAQKGTGGSRRVVLRWARGRYVGTVDGRDLCLDGHEDELGTARFRYSATRIDAYYSATYTGCGTGTGREAIAWRGVKVGAGGDSNGLRAPRAWRGAWSDWWFGQQSD